MKKENKAIKGIKIALNVVFYLLIICILLFSVSNFGMKTNLD